MFLGTGVALAQTESSKSLPVVRWKGNAPGCTSSRTSDGKFLYRLETNDLDVTLSVDGQELQLTRRRLMFRASVLSRVNRRVHGAELSSGSGRNARKLSTSLRSFSFMGSLVVW